MRGKFKMGIDERFLDGFKDALNSIKE